MKTRLLLILITLAVFLAPCFYAYGEEYTAPGNAECCYLGEGTYNVTWNYPTPNPPNGTIQIGNGGQDGIYTATDTCFSFSIDNTPETTRYIFEYGGQQAYMYVKHYEANPPEHPEEYWEIWWVWAETGVVFRHGFATKVPQPPVLG